MYTVCVFTCVFVDVCVIAASLFVKGPTEPVVEGQSVTLECLDSESELNLSSMHFEKMSRVRSNYSKADFVLCDMSPSLVQL